MLETNERKTMQFVVLDIVGKVVYSDEIVTEKNLDLTFLSEGIYYLIIEDNPNSLNQKIIIQ